jgi:hypothetical protein
VVRPKTQNKSIKEEDQKWFRSTIGSLLYLVKLSRPELANPVREMSKVIDSASPAHQKELKRLIRFIPSTKGKGLKIEADKDKTWKIIAYSDSDYPGENGNRKSITGFIILVCGVPISWKLKAQATVALSSIEGEYIGLCKTICEVKFIS